MRPLLPFLLLPSLLFLSSLQAQTPSEANPAATPELQQALADLNHRDFATRNTATLTLWKIGKPALPHLQKLADSSDNPEVAHRASQLAVRIDFGLAPGSPREILDFLEAYVNSPQDARFGLLRQKLGEDTDPASIEALIRYECRTDPTMANRALAELARTFYIRILKGETKATSRVAWEAALNYLEGDIPHSNPAKALESLLTAQGDTPPFSSSPPPLDTPVPRSELLHTLSQKDIPAALESLRKSVAAGDYRSATLRRLALFEFLAGDPDKTIKEFAAEFATKKTSHHTTLLIYLHRLKGELDKAAPYAADFPETDAALATFADLGDWPSFRSAWLAKSHPDLNPIEEAGIKAALAQLANDADARRDAVQKLTQLEPNTYPERLQQLENLLLLGGSKPALDIVDRNLKTSPEFSTQALYARWKIAILSNSGKIDEAIAFASPIVEAHPWRSSHLTSEFADLLISQNKKLPKWITQGRGVPTTSIGSYIQTLKKAGETKTLGNFHVQISYRTTFPRQRRFAEGHFPDAPKGHAAMWWFFLGKKFPADPYWQRLARVASRLAAFPGAEVPDGVEPTSPEAIIDDLEAMLQFRTWLANRCSTQKDTREITETWLSMAIPFTHPDSDLEPFLFQLSSTSNLSPASTAEVIAYLVENHHPGKAAFTFGNMGRFPSTAIFSAAYAKVESVPDEATRFLLRAHLLPLEDPARRFALIAFLTRLGLDAEAKKSRRILHALWSPTQDGFAPNHPNKPTTKLESQRRWLQHFTAQTFHPLTEPPSKLNPQSSILNP